jgi:hypothetical protein
MPAEKMEPSTDGALVQECMVAVSEHMFPERRRQIDDIKPDKVREDVSFCSDDRVLLRRKCGFRDILCWLLRAAYIFITSKWTRRQFCMNDFLKWRNKMDSSSNRRIVHDSKCV